MMDHALLGGRYQIIRRLSAGGFSRTFLVRDLHLPNNPKCVIKQLKLQDKDTSTLEMARRLFDTEARVLYHLGDHPHIPTLLAHFEENREFYLAQEYIEGDRLSRHLVEGQPWSESRTILLLEQVLEILTFVHQQQVIHRDVKPSNLIRRREDGKIVLIDFGAVKQVTQSPLVDAETGATNLTVAIGTQGYMPSEQYAGKPRFSSDVYAIGMIGIRALTGIHPRNFQEDPITGELDWHRYAPNVSPQLLMILDRMVRYDFRDRYPTALEALRDLQIFTSPAASGQQQSYSLQAAAQDWALATAAPSDDSHQGTSEGDNDAQTTADLSTAALAADTLAPVQDSPPKAIPWAISVEPATELLPRSRFSRSTSLWVGGVLSACGATFLLWQSGLIAALNPATLEPITAFSSAVMPDLPTDLTRLLPPTEKAAYLVKQGDRLQARGRYPEALDIYDQAMGIQADYAPAYLGRCQTLTALKRPAEAIPACDDALAYKGYYPQAVRSKGNAIEQQGRLLEALKLYESTNNLMPAMAEAWIDRGRVLQKLNRSAEAIQVLNQAIARNRNLPEAWAVLGAANWSLRRYDEAIVALDKALQLDPEYAPAKELRQRAKDELGR